MCHRLLVKYQVWRGKAIDVGLSDDYPANVLSNTSNNAFLFDGISCGSMDSFLLSLGQADTARQRQICSMSAYDARQAVKSINNGQLWWKGAPLTYKSAMFASLIKDAYRAMFVQNDDFQTALLATAGMNIYYTNNKRQKLTVIDENEFSSILYDLRTNSHEIIINTLERKDAFLKECAISLIDETKDLVSQILSNVDKDKSNIISRPADPYLFPRVFSFYSIVDFISSKDSPESTGVWLVKVGVTDGIDKYTCPLCAGSPERLLRQLSMKQMPEIVRLKLVAGCNSLET